MKSQIRNFMISAGAAAMLSAPVLTAQTRLETAEVPFDFTAGSTSLTAGTYAVDTLNNHTVLVLRNEETQKSIIIGSPIRGSLTERSVLAFHCYGERCFLSEVDVPGTPAYVLKQDKMERETSSNTDTKTTMAFVPMERR